MNNDLTANELSSSSSTPSACAINALRETLNEELGKTRYDTISCGVLNTLLGACNEPVIEMEKDESDPLCRRFRELQHTKYQPAADELWRVYKTSKKELDQQFKSRPERIDEFVQRRYERERNRLKSRIECSLKNLHKAEYNSKGCSCTQNNHNNWHKTAIEKQIAQEYGGVIAPVEDHFHYDYHALFTAIDLHNLTNDATASGQQPSNNSYLESPVLPSSSYFRSPIDSPTPIEGYQLPNTHTVTNTPPQYNYNKSSSSPDSEDIKIVNVISTTKSKTPPYGTRTLHILEKWYNENVEHPYADKKMLANLSIQTGLNQEQIRKWLANRRNRCRNVKRPAEIANWRRQKTSR